MNNATLIKIAPRHKIAIGTREWLSIQIERMLDGEIFGEVVVLTPELAGIFLEANPLNRNLSKTNLRKFTRDLVDGRWRLNGESMIIANTGEMNDGQHRCQIVFETGVSMETFISFGVERSTRLTTDQGAVRTAGNFLAMVGVANSTAVAHACRLLHQYEKFGRVGRGPDTIPTKIVIQEVAEENPGLADSIEATVPRKARMVCSRGIMVFCHYVFAKIDRTDADDFMDKVGSGLNLGEGDPIVALRDRLERYRDAKKSNEPDTVQCFFRAWNFYRANKTIRSIQLSDRLPVLK